MMRRALYGRVLLLWGWAFGSQHYIDIGIDVDGGEAQLRATQSDEEFDGTLSGAIDQIHAASVA